MHRRYAILEVLEDNVPALALYAKEGYHLVQRGVVLRRDPVPGEFPGPPRAFPGIREFRREDARGLVPLADRLAVPELREITPASPDRFLMLPLIAASTSSQSAAWVLEHQGTLVGFLRATAGGITRTAHLTQPLIADDAPVAAAAGLIETGLRWIHDRGPVRVIVEVPEARTGPTEWLTAAGFATAYRLETLALDLQR